MGKLTDLQVKGALPGTYPDGGGLRLKVQPSGTRSWVLRVRVGGKRRDVGLGGYPKVTLADARKRAAEARARVADGDNPTGRRAVPTFEAMARQVYELNVPRWRSDQTRRQWISSLERHAFPAFGDVAVDRITRADVLAVVLPTWTTKREATRKLRQRIRAVFAHALAHGHIDTNPAGEVIDAALPAQPPTRGPQRALDWRDTPDAVQHIMGCGSGDATRLWLVFTVLTAARSSESRLATWDEIDFDRAEWRVPAERMKSGREHVVPLAPQAVDVLRKAEAFADGSALIFPSPQRPGRPLTWEAGLKLLKSNGIDSSVHGFRAAARTFALEATSAPWAVAELMLAHGIGNDTERVYVRGDLRDQRRALVCEWADHVMPSA